jgi:hypothetical protein
MGRLKRDRRMVGLFPSNFVELLSEDYQPWARREYVAAEQRAGTSQAGAAEVEEHVPEAFYSLRSCRRSEPSGSGA